MHHLIRARFRLTQNCVCFPQAPSGSQPRSTTPHDSAWAPSRAVERVLALAVPMSGSARLRKACSLNRTTSSSHRILRRIAEFQPHQQANTMLHTYLNFVGWMRYVTGYPPQVTSFSTRFKILFDNFVVTF